MDAIEFLSLLWGDSGSYCIFGADKAKGKKIQKFYSDIPSAVAAAAQMDANGLDTYFGLATFKKPEEAERLQRLAEHAHQMRSFFLDLDCGPEKEFSSQVEALQALRQFCKVLKLPKPMMVSSGRGVHVYWPLTEPVDATKWRHGAERLKEACRRERFDADPTITADVARILRVPGTHNYKDTPPKPVSVFDSTVTPVDFGEFCDLLPEAPLSLEDFATAMSAKDDPLSQRLLSNKASSFAAILERNEAGTGCAQIKYTVENQDKVDEPLWRAVLSIAQHCEDAHSAIHAVSELHPHYDHDDTVDKANRIKGPYLCTRFDDYNPDVCKDCQFFGKIKSPIVLGQYVKEAEPEEEDDEEQEYSPTDVREPKVQQYPKGYFLGEGGGVYRKIPSKDKDEPPEVVAVYHNPLYVIRRVSDPDSGENLVWRLHLPKDGTREFTVPLAAVTSREEFRKVLSTEGVPAYGEQLNKIMDYARAWVNNLQEISEAETANRQFGWSDYDTYPSFILGDKEIFPDRVEYNPPSTSTIGFVPIMKQRGTLAGWVETTKFYSRKDMEIHQFIIGCCAGAPLMALTPLHGGILHLMSGGSGYGKTTTALSGLSIWGNPSELILNEDDTWNSRMSRAEIFCNLPVVMDELTNAEPKDVSANAYQISNGRQRNRMQGGNNRERWRGRPWHTTFITTANSSMFDKLNSIKMAAKGEGHRILEHQLQKVLFSTKAETDEFAYQLSRNFGHVGVPLVQYYMRDMVKTRERLRALQDQIDKAVGLTAEDRFYSGLAAVSLAGLIALKNIGVVDFDVKHLYKWVTQELLPTSLSNVRDMDTSIQRILNDYINDNYGSVLRIKSTDTVGNTGNAGLDQLTQVPDKQPGGRFVARYETDTEKLYVVPTPFKRWCALRQISYQMVSEELKKEFGATVRKVRLNKGTRFNMPPTDAWEVNLNIDNVI